MRLSHGVVNRARGISLWRLERIGRITKDGRVKLNVPLMCDGAGRVILGSNVKVGFREAALFGDGMVRLQARSADALITVGPGTSFSNNVQVIAQKCVTIGANCLIGDAALIVDSDFHNLNAEGRHRDSGLAADVVLEDNIFVGSRAIIMKGVTIGKDSVIGAGSVVVSSIPSGVIAGGNPAKVLRPL